MPPAVRPSTAEKHSPAYHRGCGRGVVRADARLWASTASAASCRSATRTGALAATPVERLGSNYGELQRRQQALALLDPEAEIIDRKRVSGAFDDGDGYVADRSVIRCCGDGARYLASDARAVSLFLEVRESRSTAWSGSTPVPAGPNAFQTTTEGAVERRACHPARLPYFPGAPWVSAGMYNPRATAESGRQSRSRFRIVILFWFTIGWWEMYRRVGASSAELGKYNCLK